MRIWAACLTGFVCVSQAQADPNLASDKGMEGFVSADRLPVPQDKTLALGHVTYADTCQNCHGGNKATGAPKVTSLQAWAPRIDQGLGVLIDHAINGFVGPKYTQMPARGANPNLTDAEVKAAVLFMVWQSGGRNQAETYIEHQNERYLYDTSTN